ncbi:nephrin-like [Copidosoma floridanum]|uniref:nephrin-like n=1 Tax=Copidosoma floridanum TaxID=29053 RepID=UPI0006C9E224|nr:nephrin-like [Copidosoma floridanum]
MGNVTSVSGVAEGSVQLPCNLEPEFEGDTALIVVWYKGSSNEPIYSFDTRRRGQFNDVPRWSSPQALGRRAYFSTATKPAHLSINDLKSKDEGLYRCRVDFLNWPTSKQTINLTVIEPPSKPEIIDGDTLKPIQSKAKSYNEGSDLRLICRTRGGRPAPRLVWFLDNTVIDNSYDYKAGSGETTNHLSFLRINRQHRNAQLICQASNTNLGTPQSAYVTLDVNLKPLDVHILTKEMSVKADKKYKVECRSTGSRPAAVITWWKANKRIDNQTETYTPGNNQSLSILSFVPSIKDNGAYLTCRAENPNITNSALEDKWHLDVHHQPLVSLKMGPSLNPDDIKEGDDVYFECDVRANPKIYKLSWFKDGKELRNNATLGIVRSDHSLVLQGISRGSAGEYTCTAVNTEGGASSNPVPLRVKYAPVCKEGKSEVVVGALKLETVTLICSVESHPPPETFHWTFNNSGEPIEVPQLRYSHHATATGAPPATPPASATSHQQQHQTDNHLREYQQFRGALMNYTPTTEMEYGTVACWASNQVGKQGSPCLFQVIAAGRPYALHNCTATEMSQATELENPGLVKPASASGTGATSATGLLVRCIEGYDGGLPIQHYFVEVVSDEEEGSELILNKTVLATSGAGGPTIRVAGLTAGRNYKLFLYAVNAKGRSEATVLEPVTLKGAAMYTTENADATAINPLLLGLVGVAIILALLVAKISASIYRKHSNGLAGSPKHAIACEPANAGSTTPVHPQTKQAVDDIDPDIIPNEYERRPLTSAPVQYKTPPQRRRARANNNGSVASPSDEPSSSPEMKPMVQRSNLELQHAGVSGALGEADLMNEPLSARTYVAPNHFYNKPGLAQLAGYTNSPTIDDFKQMAFNAYQRNHNQNVYYSLQRPNTGLPTIPHIRPVPSSISADGKIHRPEVVTRRANQIQESCI